MWADPCSEGDVSVSVWSAEQDLAKLLIADEWKLMI